MSGHARDCGRHSYIQVNPLQKRFDLLTSRPGKNPDQAFQEYPVQFTSRPNDDDTDDDNNHKNDSYTAAGAAPGAGAAGLIVSWNALRLSSAGLPVEIPHKIIYGGEFASRNPP